MDGCSYLLAFVNPSDPGVTIEAIQSWMSRFEGLTVYVGVYPTVGEMRADPDLEYMLKKLPLEEGNVQTWLFIYLAKANVSGAQNSNAWPLWQRAKTLIALEGGG